MKNKVYSKPVVVAEQVKMSSLVMAGSPTKGLNIGDPINDGVGG